MKKIILYTSILLLLSLCLSSLLFIGVSAKEPPFHSFDSYDELYKIFSVLDSEESLRIRNEHLSDEYTEFCKFMVSEADIMVPKLNNDVICVRDYGISLYFWGEVCILYWCEYAEKQMVSVEVKYLPAVQHVKIEKSDTISDVMDKLHPNFVCNELYEKEIKLHDRSVTARIYVRDDDNIVVCFLCGDMCVKVNASSTILTKEFFSAFSVGKYSETSMQEATGEVIEPNGTPLIDVSTDVPIDRPTKLPSENKTTDVQNHGCSSSLCILPISITAAVATGYAVFEKRKK